MGTEPLRYGDLADIGRDVLWGLIAEFGEAAWAGTYEYRWERDWFTWEATLAGLAAATAGRRPAQPLTSMPPFLSRVVRTRIDAMATRTHAGAFTDIRVLERLGLVELDHDDQYVLALVGALAGRLQATTKIDELHADPDLIPILWRLFEVEGGGEVSLANVDRFISSRETSWEQTFQLLVAEGSLPRDRVLTSCLDALLRDFSAYRARWYSSLYTVLTPTLAELTAHQDRLRTVLGSSVTASVSLAARSLRQVSTAELLDDAACAELAPGLLGRTKGPALDVLRILDDVARRTPGLRDEVVATATAGLDHPQADVQKRAAVLLTRLGASEVVAAAADHLAPAVRHDLDLGPAAASGHATPAAPVDLTAAALAVPAGRDLAEHVARLLEGDTDPIAIELGLAGLAGLAHGSSEDRAVLAPLSKRVVQLTQRPGGLAESGATAATFAVLVAAALSAGDPAVDPGQLLGAIPDPSGSTTLLTRRAARVGSMLLARQPPEPLLATPTSSGGWIEPAILAARLRDATAAAPEDLVAALLRLAPPGRAEALPLVTRGDEAGQVLRYALGGPAPSHRSAIRTPDLWVAAARSRAPQDEDPFLIAAGLGGAGQGRPVIARVQAGRHFCQVDVDHPADGPGELQPTAVAAPPVSGGPHDWLGDPDVTEGLRERPVGTPPDWIRWAVSSYPHDAEPVFTQLCAPMSWARGWAEGGQYIVPQVLAALTAHPGHLGTAAVAALAAGLAGGEAQFRVLAIDAAAAQVMRGALTADQLARGIAVFAPTTPLPRWAASLGELAAVLDSPFVPAVLTRLLPDVDPQQRGLGTLLEVLLNESLRRGLRADDPGLRAYLEKFTGSSKTARAARDLLKL